MNYLVGDFIIRVKNAYLGRRPSVVLPFSGVNKAIGKLLVKEGFLKDIKEEETDGKKQLVAALRYTNRRAVLTEVKIVSKPSLRVYITAKEIMGNQFKDRMISILSTSQGVMSGKEAIKKGVGGELLFKVA